MALLPGAPSAGVPRGRGPMLQASILALLMALAAGKEELKGEWGQQVFGCRCAGAKRTNGYCGYHFHWGSHEDKPWCRTLHHCGVTNIKGSWSHCDDRGVERRRAEDGQLYNSKKFKEFYGDLGKDKWLAAEAQIEKRIAKNGKPYTVFEFRDYYVDALGEQGWVTEWASAWPEQRQAHDGNWYTWEDFIERYGKAKAQTMWAAAKRSVKSDL